MDITQDDLLKMIGMREVQIYTLRRDNAVLNQTVNNLNQQRLDLEADLREAREKKESDGD